MKLHLLNEDVVNITRLTCGHYTPSRYDDDSCNWNINPIALVNEQASGYFAVGPWGCDGYHTTNAGYVRTPENFEQLIPICSVVKITEVGKWI